MTKEIKLDFMTCTDREIENALIGFEKGKIDYILIENIFPAYFEDRYDMEIDKISNGRDMDWWGTINGILTNSYKIPVFGCCRYGYVTIEREEEE